MCVPEHEGDVSGPAREDVEAASRRAPSWLLPLAVRNAADRASQNGIVPVLAAKKLFVFPTRTRASSTATASTAGPKMTSWSLSFTTPARALWGTRSWPA